MFVASSSRFIISKIFSMTTVSMGRGGIYDVPPMVTGTPLILPPLAKKPSFTSFAMWQRIE